MNEDPAVRRAGLLRRLAALLYDAFLVVALWMCLGFAVQLVVGPDTNTLVDGRVQTDPLLSRLLFLLMLLSAAAFYIGFWRRGGQTLGMVAWRIRVTSLDGSRISLRQGIIRFLAAWPAFFCLGLGYLWLYFDPNGDAAHDRLSGTRVILVPKGVSRSF